MNIRTLCFALVLPTSIIACSTTSEDADLTRGARGTAASNLVVCDPIECGPPVLGQPTEVCADGSTGGNTGRCVRTDDTKCHWEDRTCPPTKPPPAPCNAFPNCERDGAC